MANKTRNALMGLASFGTGLVAGRQAELDRRLKEMNDKIERDAQLKEHEARLKGLDLQNAAMQRESAMQNNPYAGLLNDPNNINRADALSQINSLGLPVGTPEEQNAAVQQIMRAQVEPGQGLPFLPLSDNTAPTVKPGFAFQSNAQAIADREVKAAKSREDIANQNAVYGEIEKAWKSVSDYKTQGLYETNPKMFQGAVRRYNAAAKRATELGLGEYDPVDEQGNIVTSREYNAGVAKAVSETGENVAQTGKLKSETAFIDEKTKHYEEELQAKLDNYASMRATRETNAETNRLRYNASVDPDLIRQKAEIQEGIKAQFKGTFGDPVARRMAQNGLAKAAGEYQKWTTQYNFYHAQIKKLGTSDDNYQYYRQERAKAAGNRDAAKVAKDSYSEILKGSGAKPTGTRVSRFNPQTEKNLLEVAGPLKGSRQAFINRIRSRNKGFNPAELGKIYDAARTQ
jgi:hypothetical protein